MAIITCPECSAPVSEYASNCPKCAYPMGRKASTDMVEDEFPTIRTLTGGIIGAIMGYVFFNFFGLVIGLLAGAYFGKPNVSIMSGAKYGGITAVIMTTGNALFRGNVFHPFFFVGLIMAFLGGAIIGAFFGGALQGMMKSLK
jgi:hypothetical protein